MLLIAFIYYPLLICKKITASDTEVFTISTRGCTIRGFPFVTQNIEEFVRPPRFANKCSQNNRLVDSNSTHVWVITDALEFFNVIYQQEFYCCYRNFAAENYVENIKYGKCIEFSSVIEAKHEFVRVECYYMDSKMYDDFFVFTNLKQYEAQVNNNTYNVLILGIESMSRMNFHRTMSKTAAYLHQKGAVELLGYNKLGDNSFPNLFPLLFGDSFENVKQRCFTDKSIDHKCQFIWEKFRDEGYVTALGSDSIAGFLGEYEYNLTTPTDFYLQPLMFEARHLFRNKHYNYHQCLGSRYFYKILLDYIKGLTTNLNRNRFFGIFWEESISHEDLNFPHVMDEDYLNFLMELEESSYLDETVLIFLSDHGMRWGDIVQTEQGRLEERLPLLQVVFPDTFKRRYSEAFKNFKQNSHRLTTPYDIYETLNEIANPLLLEDHQIKQRSVTHNSLASSSLFLPISDRRTCDTVGVKEHWCTCYKGKKLKIQNIIRSLAAEHLINHINDLLKPYPHCRKLKVKNVMQVTMVESRGVRFYTVVLETAPGGGILDGTLYKEKGHWIVSGTVSRLNLYGNQSCIDNNLAKMYCYCA